MSVLRPFESKVTDKLINLSEQVAQIRDGRRMADIRQQKDVFLYILFNSPIKMENRSVPSSKLYF